MVHPTYKKNWEILVCDQKQKKISLDLTGNQQVKDVSMLGNVHTLYLSWCDGITDVSKLGGVTTLDLSFCRGITDVSKLGGVNTLDLRECDRRLKGVSKLTNVKNLLI